MVTTFRFPSPEPDADGAAFAPDSFVPKRRNAPEGYDVSTTITAHGLQAEDLVKLDKSKCQNHRQRFPEVEAVLQLFFRLCVIVLNVTVLIIVRILDTGLDRFIRVQKLYWVVCSFRCELRCRACADVCLAGRVLSSPQHHRGHLSRQSAADAAPLPLAVALSYQCVQIFAREAAALPPAAVRLSCCLRVCRYIQYDLECDFVSQSNGLCRRGEARLSSAFVRDARGVQHDLGLYFGGGHWSQSCRVLPDGNGTFRKEEAPSMARRIGGK